METRKRYSTTPVIYIASDQGDDQYLYRQAFGKANPIAILYFFADKKDLISALQGEVYPKPSLLLMDWNMVTCEGYETLDVLAKNPVWQTIPVIILAGAQKPVDEARCQAMGYELVLPKEARYDRLVDQLRGLMLAFL